MGIESLVTDGNYYIICRCIFNMDSSTETCECRMMESLVRKDLVMNIYQNGSLGSFRHLPLHTSKTPLF